MDYSWVTFDFVKATWWVVPVVILMSLIKTPWFKGLWGEILVKIIARWRLPAEIYRPVHNVTLPTPDGSTQIDHVFVSPFGVFVVETKNMRGWIFGSERQSHWTQKIYRKSFRFQNPLRQNYKHAKALQRVLDLPDEHIHSVVVFVGEAILKTKMPPNVTKGVGYISYIKSFTQPVLSEEGVNECVRKIQSARFSPSRETNRQHIYRLKCRSEYTADRKCQK